MSTFNGLTMEEAIAQGKLIPIDTTDPTWVEKLKEWINHPESLPKPKIQHQV